MVFAGRDRLGSLRTFIFLSDFQSSRAARWIGFLASHHLTVFHPIPMAFPSGHVRQYEFYHRSSHHPHCYCIHASFSRPFVCGPSSIIPPTTHVSIPNIVILVRSEKLEIRSQIQGEGPLLIGYTPYFSIFPNLLVALKTPW